MHNFIKTLLALFGIKRNNTDEEKRDEYAKYAEDYRDITKINITAIFSQRLAALATMDSSFYIPEDNKRADILKTVMSSVWKKRKKVVSLALGCGGCVIAPFVQKGKLYYNLVTQDRVNINRMDGDKIVSALIVADQIIDKTNKYFRVISYDIVNSTLVISNKVVDAMGNLSSVDQWEDIPDITIGNVDRVPFGYIKCPVDNRECSDEYGVPITYGTKKIIVEIIECLEDIRKEFKRKKTRLQVDERVFSRDEKGNLIIKDDIFITGQSEDGNMFNIFDPAIRDSSYYNRLKNLFELLEKSVGTSKGILTEPATTYENVEAIRAAVRDTWSLVTDIRDAFANASEDFLYACNMLANFYNLSPMGEYSISFDWDYSMIEKTSDTWMQKKDLQTAGAMSKAELRAWHTGEDIDTAQKAVDEITKKEPNIKTLIGMSD